MTCVIPNNQPIYNALLDKAASYPSDKAFQIAAYKKAAEGVRTWKYNLYGDDHYEDHYDVPGVGSSIGVFIEDFIESNPALTSVPNATNTDDAIHEAYFNEVDRLIRNGNKVLNPTYESPLIEAIMKKPIGETLTVQEIIQIAKDNATARSEGKPSIPSSQMASLIKQNAEARHSEQKTQTKDNLRIIVNPDMKGVSIDYSSRDQLIRFINTLITQHNSTFEGYITPVH
jgi:hypothetical protein